MSHVKSVKDEKKRQQVMLWYASLGYNENEEKDKITQSGGHPSIRQEKDTHPWAGVPPAHETVDTIMSFVLSVKQQYVTWEHALRGLVCDCFIDSTWSFDMAKEVAVCRKIEATLSCNQEAPHLEKSHKRTTIQAAVPAEVGFGITQSPLVDRDMPRKTPKAQQVRVKRLAKQKTKQK
jgi:hypothetical protein